MENFKYRTAEMIAGLPSVKEAGLLVDEIYGMIEVPSESAMGDYAFPCFRLAKSFKKAPQLIASAITEEIKGQEEKDSVSRDTADGLIERAENVNAYVNFFLKREIVTAETVEAVLSEGSDFGRSDFGAGRKVIVEFSSPNIAKPFHIGHIRSTVIGNAINNIYDFLGFDTVKINHLGDYGTQFGKMITAYRHWGSREEVEKNPIKTLLSYYTKFHEAAKEDPSLDDEARETFLKLENGKTEETEIWQWFREESLSEFNRVYGMLGIEFDSFAGESFYSDKMQRVVDELKAKGLLKESDGAQIVDLSEYGLGAALITKKDGSTLYITRDIAASLYRKEHYDFYKNLYIVASQQNLHFQQWIKIVSLLGYDWAEDCVHIPFGLVSLEDGTMSTREGRVVFLEDVLNKAVTTTKDIIIEKDVNTDNIDETAAMVGIGAVIFQELSNNRIKDYVFDWNRVLNFEGETGPYVQYSHARAAGVLRKATEARSSANETAGNVSSVPDGDSGRVDVSFLTSDNVYSLVKLLYSFPDIIREAGDKYEPSIVTRHIVNIAQSFNKFYHDEHVLVENPTEMAAKIALVTSVKIVLKTGLELLGIGAPEKM